MQFSIHGTYRSNGLASGIFPPSNFRLDLNMLSAAARTLMRIVGLNLFEKQV